MRQDQQLFNSSILEQQTLIPEIYGSVYFGRLADRYNTGVDSNKIKPSRCLFDNSDLVDRIRNCTMMGDKVLDAYVALIPEYAPTGLG